MTVAKLKAAIRERDGHRCRRCGITADECRAKFGKALAVHRETPQAAYSMEDCLTLCRACHYERHRELKAAGVKFVITPHHMTLGRSRDQCELVPIWLRSFDLHILDEIAARLRLNSRDAAARYAIGIARDALPPPPRPKGRPKGSKDKPKPPPA